MKKKYISIFATAVVVAIILLTTSSKLSHKSKTVSVGSPVNGFAVLELFTSQGCSSCPPADALLGRYAAKADENIFTLSFHVDYWNRLGWKDPFSSAAYSQRQKDYAMIIDKSTVYTPQLIVNGIKEMVGSDENAVSGAVSNALKTSPALQIVINKIETKNYMATISFTVDKNIKNCKVNAALVQAQITTAILKGENEGVKLTNYNVVRDFVSNPLVQGTSFVNLQLPENKAGNNYSVVLYVQEDASGKIIAATKQKL